jgi:cytoskeletal protein CcmA (bactofilin family)
MSIFAKQSGERPMPRVVEPSTNSYEGTVSVIGAGLKITGDVESSGVIKVEGTVEGNIRGARQLLLGKGGTIRGDLHANEIVLAGTVVGTVSASDRVEIQGSSAVHGDIYTKSIVVLEGAVINGTVRMGEGAQPAFSTDRVNTKEKEEAPAYSA